VSHYLRHVDDVSCAQRSPRVTRCEVRVRKVPVGSESWQCEFSRDRTNGADSCWSEDGSPESFRGG
jgi:hypothetical protein